MSAYFYRSAGECLMFAAALKQPEFVVSYLDEDQLVRLSETGTTSSNFSWSHQATLLLLEEYRERTNRFQDHNVKKRDLWKEITIVFQEHGYSVSEDILDKKFRNLKKTFTTILEKRSKMSTGRNPVKWEYFKLFNEIFKDSECTNFNKSLSSVQSLPCEEYSVSIQTPSPPSDHPVLVSSSKITVKSRRWRYLEQQRKAQLDLERERVQELKRLVAVVEKNNDIQMQRNNLLKALLETSNAKTM